MGVSETGAETPTEPQRVWAWRMQQFLAAGCDMVTARVLAESQVDLRLFERMTDEGCDPKLAARILL